MGTKKNTKNVNNANDGCVGGNAIPSIVNGLSYAVKDNVLMLGRINETVTSLVKRVDELEHMMKDKACEPPSEKAIPPAKGVDCDKPWYADLDFQQAIQKILDASSFKFRPGSCAYKCEGVENGALKTRFCFTGVVRDRSCEIFEILGTEYSMFVFRPEDSFEDVVKAFDQMVSSLRLIRCQRKRDQTPRGAEQKMTADEFLDKLNILGGKLIDEFMEAIGHMSDVPERQTNGSAVPPPEPESAKPVAAKPKANRKTGKAMRHKYEVSVSDPRQVREDLRAMSRYDIPENRITVGQIEYNKKSRRYAFPIIFWSCAGRPSRTNEEIQFRVYKNTDDLDSIVARFDKAVKNLKKVKFQEKEKAND